MRGFLMGINAQVAPATAWTKTTMNATYWFTIIGVLLLENGSNLLLEDGTFLAL